MFTVLIVVQAFLALGLIALVLLQHGKGADAGAAFGSGASATVFGAKGSGSFLTRTTAILATLFFANSLALSTPFVMDFDRVPASVTESLETAPAVEEELPAPADIPDLPDLSEVPEISVPAPTDAAADMPEVPVEPAAPADLPQ